MWLPEAMAARVPSKIGAAFGRAVAIVAVIAATGLVAGCNFRPLYGTMSNGKAVSRELRGIELAPMDTRVGQRLYNNLIFGFNGGGDEGIKRYDLRIILTQTDTEVSVEKFTDVPAAQLLALTASFTLTDRESGKTLMTGQSFANASYDISTQRFANIRAKRNAEDRAAMVIADDIRIRIAAHFISTGDGS